MYWRLSSQFILRKQSEISGEEKSEMSMFRYYKTFNLSKLKFSMFQCTGEGSEYLHDDIISTGIIYDISKKNIAKCRNQSTCVFYCTFIV